MPKEITFYVFLGEKRDPSEIYANSNLHNLTHITQKSCFSPTRSKKSQNKYVYSNYRLHLLSMVRLRITLNQCPFFLEYNTHKRFSTIFESRKVTEHKENFGILFFSTTGQTHHFWGGSFCGVVTQIFLVRVLR